MPELLFRELVKFTATGVFFFGVELAVPGEEDFVGVDAAVVFAEADGVTVAAVFGTSLVGAVFAALVFIAAGAGFSIIFAGVVVFAAAAFIGADFSATVFSMAGA